ncbi:MAG: nucleotidyl transferase AbiEii/AbiGii toxin family protein [Flavobacteriales bacterium]|nr:nucleotidyl transferase AbiEii/AbiGii toxin family protein [Flavobacteriales bacterium]
MKLHENKKLFKELILAVANKKEMSEVFVEKDYWISYVLFKLSKSKYLNQVVFKGGTSLSKGYNLIDRFSEDVDIAVINEDGKSNNAVKTLIRSVEKEITIGLTEINVEGVTSKGSQFRKSLFEYKTILTRNEANKLIVEVNAFSNPFPFNQLSITSFIYDLLYELKEDEYINKFQLQPFSINVLSKEQTLQEKLASLIRFSFSEDYISGISSKIRHFYDLYFLMQDDDCIRFVESDRFKDSFHQLVTHDKLIFDEPNNWDQKDLNNSPLLIDFDGCWKKLKKKYENELSTLAYRKIPTEQEISNSFKKLISFI